MAIYGQMERKTNNGGLEQVVAVEVRIMICAYNKRKESQEPAERLSVAATLTVRTAFKIKK